MCCKAPWSRHIVFSRRWIFPSRSPRRRSRSRRDAPRAALNFRTCGLLIRKTTGSCRTTITILLMRFYVVQKGRVLLDGVDVREWDLQSLRENFAVVLQDIFLFTGTVESNIRLGREDISDERVRWAAGEVRADNFVQRLPQGYKSEVRERGAGLSVGQKQLISFARALAFDPTLLILDEATSSIDTE